MAARVNLATERAVVEGGAERLALAQYGDPGQPGLEPVQHQLLPQRTSIPLGHAPFGVVVGHVQRVGPAPAASAAESLWGV